MMYERTKTLEAATACQTSLYQCYARLALRMSAAASCWLLTATIIITLWEAIAHAAPTLESAERETQDLTQLSLEELMNIEVTSVSKKSQPVAQTAAAIFVITQEDIRRSGANSIPDVLRMVPGLHVARIDSNKWAITSRAPNGRFADDMLVMIDGRTVYSPLVGGVFWEMQDTVLEDIDRIEVIRGSGGSLSGANTANGSISIITKHAKDTQGGLAVVGGGTEERAFTSLRYGGRIGEDFNYRLYGKAIARDSSWSPQGAHDDWRTGHWGLRTDWKASTNDTLTVQGDSYSGRAGQETTLPTLLAPTFQEKRVEDVRFSGTNLLSRWTHAFSNQSDLKLQLYYDRTDRNELTFREIRDTYDLDFQHRFPLPLQQDLIWGLGYRLSADRTRENSFLSFTPSHRNLQTLSGFIQDEISLFGDTLHISLGSKFIKNTYTNVLLQPNLRVTWTPQPTQTVWASVSRTSRLPTRVERDSRRNEEGSGTGFTQLLGNPGSKGELWTVGEVGYRGQLADSLAIDVAAFMSSEKQGDTEEDVSPGVTRFTNGIHLTLYGGEIAADWKALSWWRLRPAFTYFQARESVDPGKESENESGTTPNHQLSVRSLMNLTDQMEFDATYRFVDRISALGVGSYHNLDLRLGWHPRKDLEFSIVGQNLLQQHHQEFVPTFIPTASSQIQRGLYGKLTWRF